MREKRGLPQDKSETEVAEALQGLMEATLEAFDGNNREKVLENLAVLYQVIEDGEQDLREKEIEVEEMALPRAERLAEFLKRIEALKSKIRAGDKVNLILDDIQKDFSVAVEINDSCAERTRWLDLYSLEKQDLKELENLLTTIAGGVGDELLDIGGDDGEEGEEWKNQ